MPARGFAGIPPDAICFYQHRETEPPPMPKRGENKIQANAGQAGSTWAAFTASLAAPGWHEELQQWASIAEAIAAPGWDEGGPEPAPRAEKNAEIDDKAEEDAEKEKPPEAPVELMRLIKSRICEPWQPYIQAQAELYAAEEAEEDGAEEAAPAAADQRVIAPRVHDAGRSIWTGAGLGRARRVGASHPRDRRPGLRRRGS